MPVTSSGAGAGPARAATREPPSGQKTPARIVIQYPAPAVDGGRYPAKRGVGDTGVVSADVFRDGHDLLRAAVRWRGPDERRWHEAGLRRVAAHLERGRWTARVPVLA